MDKEDDTEKERRRRRRPEMTWGNWLPGFLIYVEVIVRAQPLEGPDPVPIPGLNLQGVC